MNNDYLKLEKAFNLIIEVYRARRYYHDGGKTWYEKCPVIKQTEKRLTVKSQNFPDTPLSPGGTFQLNLQRLKEDGKVYHSKNHDYFYLVQPKQGDLFPSKEVVETPDWVCLEAMNIGWTIDGEISINSNNLSKLKEWQRRCVVIAQFSKISLKRIVEIYEKGTFLQLEKAYYTWDSKSWHGLDGSIFKIPSNL